jgi:cytidylate kinase
MSRTVAMDGPSGAGKSTVAKMISEVLGFRYLDTGALYRAVALGLIKNNMRPESPDDEIGRTLENISVSFEGDKVLLDGDDVSEEIRTPEMGHYASVFSSRGPVRDFLMPLQKRIAEEYDVVAEGRDMTTVVFPDAWKKIYLDGSVESRAERRYLQLRQNGVLIDMERAFEDVVERDRRDSSRDLAPLRVAEDAVYIDTSAMSIEEVIKRLIEEIRKG